jgi:hypothetical protein
MKWAKVLIVLLNFVCIAAFAQQDSGKAVRQAKDSSAINKVGIDTPMPIIDEKRMVDTSKHCQLSHLNLFLNIGVGLPLGKYSASYFDYVSSSGLTGSGFKGEGGFAMPGLSIDVLAEMPWKETNWGFAGQIGYSLNKFNMNDYAYGYNYNSSAFYNSFSLMPGVFAEFKGDNISLEFRALAGLLICTSPELKYSGDSIIANFPQSTQDTVSITRDIKSSAAGAFAFDIGMSLRYFPNGKLIAGLNIDYLQAYPTFSSNQVFTQNGSPSFSFTSAYCPVSILTVSLTIGYKF